MPNPNPPPGFLELVVFLLMLSVGLFNLFGAVYKTDMWVHAVLYGRKSATRRWLPMQFHRVIYGVLGAILSLFGLFGMVAILIRLLLSNEVP